MLWLGDELTCNYGSRIRLFEEREEESRYSQCSMKIEYENYVSIESLSYDFKYKIVLLDEY